MKNEQERIHFGSLEAGERGKGKGASLVETLKVPEQVSSGMMDLDQLEDQTKDFKEERKHQQDQLKVFEQKAIDSELTIRE